MALTVLCVGTLWGLGRYMSEAMKTIVEAYVQLGKRKALEELKTHRTKILFDLRIAGQAIDVGFALRPVEAELAIIEAGLERMDSK